MKALLDTHTFLWWIGNSEKLSPTVRELILSGKHEIFLSAVIVWEISIKAQKGRLQLPKSPEQTIAEAQIYYRFHTLPIQINHACYVYHLPYFHTDPFDRLLVSQCRLENMVLLSHDEIMSQYDIEVVW